jgi:hypothetical protein
MKEALKCRRCIARCLLFLARLTGRNVCDVDFQEIISFFNSVWDAKKCVLEQVRSGIHKIILRSSIYFFRGVGTQFTNFLSLTGGIYSTVT